MRDGRNQVTPYEVAPVGSPSGPVERDRASEQRMADFAAERAAAAEHERKREGQRPRYVPTPSEQRASSRRGTARSAEVRAAAKSTEKAVTRRDPPHHDAGRAGQRPPRPTGLGSATKGQRAADRDERARLVADALARYPASDPDRIARAAAALGMKTNAVAMIAKHLAIRAGSESVQQGQEASAPATAAVDLGTTASPAAEGVATPRGPIPVMEPEYSVPDLTQPDGVSLHLTIKVSAAEMAGWAPDRISRFFAGIAMATAARSEVTAL